MLRPLTRWDLPKRRTSGNSMHIPVVYQNKLRFVCDIHLASDELCYLEENHGVPVKISDCELITDYPAYLKVVKTITGNITLTERKRSAIGWLNQISIGDRRTIFTTIFNMNVNGLSDDYISDSIVSYIKGADDIGMNHMVKAIQQLHR